MNDSWRIDAQRAIWANGVELRVGVRHKDGGFSVAQPLIMQRMTEEQLGMIVQPCAMLPWTAAQNLMDELWHVGIRPTEGTGSAGSLAATERHLEDMKRIAFHALKIPTNQQKS